MGIHKTRYYLDACTQDNDAGGPFRCFCYVPPSAANLAAPASLTDVVDGFQHLLRFLVDFDCALLAVSGLGGPLLHPGRQAQRAQQA
mgnify:CR=1 FL=1